MALISIREQKERKVMRTNKSAWTNLVFNALGALAFLGTVCFIIALFFIKLNIEYKVIGLVFLALNLLITFYPAYDFIKALKQILEGDSMPENQ